MSSRKGGGCRSRGQKHQNSTAYKNDKYGASPRVKKANAKVHDGLCQRCKDKLEWRVKFNKYRPLSQPRTCVKCLQKTVKDAYHIMCKPCALNLELCAKCGKNEEVVIPLDKKDEEEEEQEEAGQQKQRLKKQNPHRTLDDGNDFEEDDEEEDFGEMDSDCEECDSGAGGK